jgi:hypothetical protein
VGQVTAVSQIKPQYGVAGFDERMQDSRVRLRTGVRLDVGECGAEQ